MKNTIVDKSLDNIIIFCQSVTIRQLREKYIRKTMVLVLFHLPSVRHPNISAESCTKPQQ